MAEFVNNITQEEKDAAKAAFEALLVAKGVDLALIKVILVSVDVVEGCRSSGGRRLLSGGQSYTAIMNFLVTGPAVTIVQVR